MSVAAGTGTGPLGGPGAPGRPAAPLGTPEAERWLTMPLRPGLRVVVAGVAGGVGTTTVAALVARALAPHRDVEPADRSGGALEVRAGLGVGSEGVDGVGTDGFGTGPSGTARAGTASAGVEPGLVVQDLGPHALTPGSNVLDDPGQVVIVVCGPHAEGLADALAAVHALGARTGEPDPSDRVVVVPVGVTRGLRGAALRRRAAELGLRAAVVPVPHDRVLAVGGPVPGPEEGVHAVGVHRVAVALGVEVVRRARWVAVRGHAAVG